MAKSSTSSTKAARPVGKAGKVHPKAKAKATRVGKAATPRKAPTGVQPAKRAAGGKPWKDPTRRGGVVSQVEGRLGIALPKQEGDTPVQAYIAALPGWQRDVAARVDAIVTRELPGVRKAIKWHNPMYGVPGRGWFLGLGSFKAHVKLMFFRGTSLVPVPPGGQQKEARYLDVREADRLDEALVASWVRQAAALPGEWPTT